MSHDFLSVVFLECFILGNSCIFYSCLLCTCEYVAPVDLSGYFRQRNVWMSDSPPSLHRQKPLPGVRLPTQPSLSETSPWCQTPHPAFTVRNLPGIRLPTQPSLSEFLPAVRLPTQPSLSETSPCCQTPHPAFSIRNLSLLSDSPPSLLCQKPLPAVRLPTQPLLSEISPWCQTPHSAFTVRNLSLVSDSPPSLHCQKPLPAVRLPTQPSLSETSPWCQTPHPAFTVRNLSLRHVFLLFFMSELYPKVLPPNIPVTIYCMVNQTHVRIH